MTLDSRINRLSPQLSARERVVLYVRAVHEGGPLDPSIGRTMPLWQVPEANRLIRIANGVIHVLLPQALVLQADVESLRLRFQLFIALAAWGSERTHLRGALALLATIPIEESEYESLVEKGRAEYLPFGGGGGPTGCHRRSPRRSARRRGVRARTAAVRESCARALAWHARSDRGRGRLHFRLRRHTVRTASTRGGRYEPMPKATYQTERWRAEVAVAELTRPDNGPGRTQFPFAPAETLSTDHPPDATRNALALRVEAEMRACWVRFLAIKLVLGDVVGWFDDDVVVPDALTTLLESAGAGLVDLRRQTEGVLNCHLPTEAGPALVHELRAAVVRSETAQL